MAFDFVGIHDSSEFARCSLSLRFSKDSYPGVPIDGVVCSIICEETRSIPVIQPYDDSIKVSDVNELNLDFNVLLYRPCLAVVGRSTTLTT